MFTRWTALLWRWFRMQITFRWPIRSPVSIDLRNFIYMCRRLRRRTNWYRCVDCGRWAHTDLGVGGCHWAERVDGKARIVGWCEKCGRKRTIT